MAKVYNFFKDYYMFKPDDLHSYSFQLFCCLLFMSISVGGPVLLTAYTLFITKLNTITPRVCYLFLPMK